MQFMYAPGHMPKLEFSNSSQVISSLVQCRTAILESSELLEFSSHHALKLVDMLFPHMYLHETFKKIPIIMYTVP